MFESNSQAIINTVNTVGVMGKGIALQFKKYFPNNFKIYKQACNNNTLTIGKLLVCEEEHLQIGRKIIINFPTKNHWRTPSEYDYIRLGLIELVKLIKERKLQSVSVPPLGAGNGGLLWSKVKVLIEEYLSEVDCEITVYQPKEEVREVLNKECVKLTPARAMMLDVLFDMVKEGEFVSEFAAEKIVYFLQRFGAADQFRLQFRLDYYGPHSGKIKQVFKYLNGSYIGEFDVLKNTPFRELNLDMTTEKNVVEYLNLPDNKPYGEISRKTKEFLSGFYSSLGLELLSTIDYIRHTENIYTESELIVHLTTLEAEKRTVLDNTEYITLINNHLNNFLA